MLLKQAFDEMSHFVNVENIFSFTDQKVELERLQAEFKYSLPQELQDYIRFYAPQKDIDLNTVGNPICLYSIEKLKFLQDGYNFNAETQEKINDWSDDWFLFADEGADPIILPLDTAYEIEKRNHGYGDWESGEGIAENIAQFLLCASYQHYALSQNDFDCIVDDEHGFNLDPEIAAWYFPQMKKYAKQYYSVWCGVFDNA